MRRRKGRNRGMNQYTVKFLEIIVTMPILYKQIVDIKAITLKNLQIKSICFE